VQTALKDAEGSPPGLMRRSEIGGGRDHRYLRRTRWSPVCGVPTDVAGLCPFRYAEEGEYSRACGSGSEDEGS
jgi:hypothetical protein